MSSDLLSGSLARLEPILADLKHLDLTGQVEYESPKQSVARGGYGEVYKGRIKRTDGSELSVAIKCLTVYLDGKRDVAKIFKREIKTWSMLRHPNVLPMLGYSSDAPLDKSPLIPSLISEWMNNGNLLDYIKQNSFADLVDLVFGMAQGLTYLHENNVIHSDFKASNVLVSAAGEALICDFGSAHTSHDEASGIVSSEVSGLRGTSRWLAYELLTNAEEYPRATKQSDTWAFGMAVYELVTNGYPFANIQRDPEVLIAIMNRSVPPYPQALSSDFGPKESLWAICTACWECDPFQRPTMSILVNRLRQIAFPVPLLEMAQAPRRRRKHIVAQPSEDPLMQQQPKRRLSTRPAPRLTYVSYAGLPSRVIEKCFLILSPSLEARLSRLRLTGDLVNISSSVVRHDDLGLYIVGRYQGSRVTVLKINKLNGMPLVSQSRSILAGILDLTSEISQHSNVQSLLGYVEELETESVAFVFSHDGDENLSTYAKNHPDCNIVELALHIAEGLAHVHDYDIVHADLRASNIFINERNQPVITGFTCSRKLPCSPFWTRTVNGSIRWMAPEVMDQKNNDAAIITKERDIWAFGMTIYELLTGDVPYANLKYEPQVVLAVAKGQLPICPSAFDTWPWDRKALWSICLATWDMEPAARPSASKLVGSLKGLTALQNLLV